MASSPRARCGPSRCSVSAACKPILRAHVERVEPGQDLLRALDGTRAAWPSTSPCCCRRSAARTCRPIDRGRRRHHRRAVRSERVPQGRRRLRGQAVRGVEAARTGRAPTRVLAIRNVFGVGIAFAPPHPISRPRTSPGRDGDLPGAAAHRDAVRRDGPGGGPSRSPDMIHRGETAATAHRVDGSDGRGVHRLGRSGHAARGRRRR